MPKPRKKGSRHVRRRGVARDLDADLALWVRHSRAVAAGAGKDPSARKQEIRLPKTTIATRLDVFDLRPYGETEIEMIEIRTLIGGATDLRREQNAQQMVSEIRDVIVVVTEIATVTHVGREVDRHGDAAQEVDPRGETEITGDDLVVDRCLDAVIIIALSGRPDRPEGVAHYDLNVDNGHVPLGEDVRNQVPAQGATRNLESGLNLARGPERESDLVLHADGQEATTERPSEPGLGLEKAVWTARLHISTKMRRRNGSKHKYGKERRRQKPTWLRRKKPVQRVCLCLALTLRLTTAGESDHLI